MAFKRRLRNNPPRRKVDWRWVKAEAEEQGFLGVMKQAAYSAEIAEDNDDIAFQDYARLAYGYFSLQNYTLVDRLEITNRARQIVLPSLYSNEISWEVGFVPTHDYKFLLVPIAWAERAPDDDMDQIWTLYNAGQQALGVILDYFEEIDPTTRRGQNLEFEDPEPGEHLEVAIRHSLEIDEDSIPKIPIRTFGPIDITTPRGVKFPVIGRIIPNIEDREWDPLVHELTAEFPRPKGTILHYSSGNLSRWVTEALQAAGIQLSLEASEAVVLVNLDEVEWKKIPITSKFLEYNASGPIRDNPRRRRR